MFTKPNWKRSIEIIDRLKPVSKNQYDQDETARVRVARISGPWHRKMPAFLETSGIKGLRLSFDKGFRFSDASFLLDLPFIEEFEYPYWRPDHDLGDLCVEQLSGLRRFIATDTVLNAIDLASFSDLRSCTIKWQPKLSSVFSTRSLRRLQITSLNWKRAPELAHLTTLENLEIAHSGIRSFEPISNLKNLTRLSLTVCPSLEDLGGIETLSDLRCLHLDELHQITDLTCLEALQNLEILTIVDARTIDSVAPLERLQKLKALWIAGAKTTITNGDLTPLTRLPQLALLNLGAKRHYSHRVSKKWNWDDLNQPDRLLEPV